ncbi:MAG: cytochrome c oxidase accessory protein CcoG [Pseudomonadota bacterium]
MSGLSQPIQYFQKEPKIYPKRVWGRYRKIKWISMIITLGIYYIAPFIRWDRGLNAPDQAILIDMENRRAYFFFIEIWPQEVYYLTGLLILAAVGLFFITSLVGRVWCGYLCFQTVWTDLFVWVERLVQGDRNARKKLDESGWTFKKIRQKVITHAIWLIIGLCTGGAWVFYFNDAPTLIEQIIHFDVPWSVLGWIVALTFTTYIMAGFSRQQVCKYMCPYARFQSAMFDRDTLIIGYDEQRGEPRGKFNEKISKKLGDCIDCSLCVQVCPVGIDIRKGLQYECITCGLCIDACNNVMDKLNLPRGLIRYDTPTNQESRQLGHRQKTVWDYALRIRTFYYIAILTAVSAIMLYSLAVRSPLDLTILHDRNPLFVKLSDGSIRNGYEIRISNKTHEDRLYRLEIEGIEVVQSVLKNTHEIDPQNILVFADSIGHFRFFVTADKQEKPRQSVLFNVRDTKTGDTIQEKSVFVSAK